MATKYRLQLRSHKEVFADREAAKTYINKYFMPDNIMAEPTVYFYGSQDSPNVILAIGLGDRKYSIIDIGETNEKLQSLDGSETSNTSKLEEAIATIHGIIESSGLTFDTNKKENQVTYEPDPKDELIGDSETIADAISVISKFVQENFKNTNLIPEDSKSINIVYKPNSDGMQLKAHVKISEYGSSDDVTDNNNIVGIKSDGIYAASNVEYDEEKSELTFVTSGMKNGKFMDDANRKVIKLGKHTQYEPDNDGNSVNIVVNKDKNTISANVRLSEDENNILVTQDNKLFVDGRATNIKYKGKTVYAGLNKLEQGLEDYKSETDASISALQKHVNDFEQKKLVDGTTSDSIITNVIKNQDNSYSISGDVRLGDEKSIIRKSSGLEVDLEINCDITKNKLIVRLGNVTKEIDLPGVDFINNAYYDANTQELVIEFNNGNNVRIPMSGLITTYSFTNNNQSPVVFQVTDTSTSGQPLNKTVTTSFKLASTDNMLSLNGNGELISPLSTVTNLVETEKNRAESAEEQIGNALQAEIDRAKAAEQSNLDKINDNKASIDTANEHISINTGNIATIMADENTAGSIMYMAKYLNDKLSGEITQEKNRAEQAENTLSERIFELKTENENSINSTITQLKEYADEKVNSTYDKTVLEIEKAKSEAISTSADDASLKSEKALSDSKEYTNLKIQELADKESTIENDIESLKEKDNELSSELDKKIENVKIVKNSSNDLQYTLLVDEIPCGEINIPEDQTLKTVSYNKVSKELEFVFKTDEGDKNIKINISDLVDEYNAGDGLNLDKNTFSIKKSSLSEKYINITSDGISINGIDNELSKKANISDVYTKEEIIEKGFLTNSDLLNYALKTDVDAEKNRAMSAEQINANDINNLELKTATLENNIANLQLEDKRLNLTETETNTVKINVNKQDNGTVIKADVKVKSDVGNILKVDGNGLYSSVSLEYNKAENKLSLVINGTKTNEYELSEHSLVQEGHYDSDSKSIVLTILKDSGTEQISIPVGDLVNEWKIDNGLQNPIILNKSKGEDGVDVLTAKLDISSEDHNAILHDNGTLYVSNRASDMTTQWDGDEISMQKAIDNLKTSVNSLNGVTDDILTIKSDISQAKNDIINVKGDVETLKSKVDVNTQDIALNKGSISTLTTQFNDLSEKVTNLSNSFDALNENVGLYDTRISNVESKIDKVNSQISTINDNIEYILNQIGEGQGDNTLLERVTKIEEEIAKLIDFGTY